MIQLYICIYIRSKSKRVSRLSQMLWQWQHLCCSASLVVLNVLVIGFGGVMLWVWAFGGSSWNLDFLRVAKWVSLLSPSSCQFWSLLYPVLDLVSIFLNHRVTGEGGASVLKLSDLLRLCRDSISSTDAFPFLIQCFH